MALYIGVDIGGTNLRVGMVDGSQIIYEKRFQADFSTICKTNAAKPAWRQIVDITSDALTEAIAAYPQVKAVGIGFPGFIDPVSNNIAQSPNLPGLHDVNLAQAVSARIKLPVIVENDALAAAYGEYRLSKMGVRGHEQSPIYQSLVYLGLGTGVGGGLIYANEPFPGQHGVAMEVGHIIIEPGGRLCGCGNRGCMEQYASTSGVTKSYQEATGNHLNAGEIAGLARAGDQHAIRAYNLAGDALAQALAHILKVIDVGQVVIGGGMSQAWPLMQMAFNQHLQADLIPVLRDKISIHISNTGDHAGIIGAALLAGARSGS